MLSLGPSTIDGLTTPLIKYVSPIVSSEAKSYIADFSNSTKCTFIMSLLPLEPDSRADILYPKLCLYFFKVLLVMITCSLRTSFSS